MKKLFTILFLATAAVSQAQNDPNAKKVLDAVSAKFKTYKAPQASFTYKVENAQGKALSTKKGTVTMKGNKYRVSMDGLEIFSDGRTIWNYDRANNEVTVNNVETGSAQMTPQRLNPGFEKRLSTPSLFLVYGAFGLALAVRGLVSSNAHGSGSLR